MKKEVDALVKNDTWELVKTPNCEIIDCRWVYRVKEEPDGGVKYKARLVARGFSQVYGENYWETYAPVVKSATVRLLLAIAVEEDMMVDQIDVRNAYVKSDLKEDIYMRQPYGFERGSGLVCKLKKSLYGLKQAGHEWNKCINKFIINDLKFERLQSDPCVYKKIENNTVIIISLYVDDILIFSRARSLINEFKNALNNKFEIEDIGSCKKIIGINVERTKNEIRIDQRQLIQELIDSTQLESSNIERTPMNTAVEITCGEENCEKCELVDSTLYRRLVGKLQYLAGSTRPDISHTTSSLARFSERPHTFHLRAIYHVIKYLKGTADYRIVFKKNGNMMSAYSDADWATCKLDRRSYTGFVVFLAEGPVAWESRKQPTVALSSTEAEYMAITSASKEIMFLSQVLEELGFNKYVGPPIKLYSDNMGAINLSKNVGFNSRTKHIHIRHHYVRMLVQAGRIELEHKSTDEMLADILTKGLGKIKHEKNLNRILEMK